MSQSERGQGGAVQQDPEHLSRVKRDPAPEEEEAEESPEKGEKMLQVRMKSFQRRLQKTEKGNGNLSENEILSNESAKKVRMKMVIQVRMKSFQRRRKKVNSLDVRNGASLDQE